MAVTIKDIAAAAGVSPSTVSRTCKDSHPSAGTQKNASAASWRRWAMNQILRLNRPKHFPRPSASSCLPPSGTYMKMPFIWRSSGHRAVLQPAPLCKHRHHRRGRCRSAGCYPEHGSQHAGRWIHPALLQKKIVRWLPICAARVCFTLSWARQRSRPTKPSISTTTTHWRARKPPTISTRWDIAASPIFGVSNAMLIFCRAETRLSDVSAQARHHPAGRGLCGD